MYNALLAVLITLSTSAAVSNAFLNARIMNATSRPVTSNLSLVAVDNYV